MKGEMIDGHFFSPPSLWAFCQAEQQSIDVPKNRGVFFFILFKNTQSVLKSIPLFFIKKKKKKLFFTDSDIHDNSIKLSLWTRQ